MNLLNQRVDLSMIWDAMMFMQNNFNGTGVGITRVFIHDESVNLDSSKVHKTSLCVEVEIDDVIDPDNLNKMPCKYGPVWGRYVYVYSTKYYWPLCEIEIYKESGTYMTLICYDGFFIFHV